MFEKIWRKYNYACNACLKRNVLFHNRNGGKVLSYFSSAIVEKLDGEKNLSLVYIRKINTLIGSGKFQ